MVVILAGLGAAAYLAGNGWAKALVSETKSTTLDDHIQPFIAHQHHRHKLSNMERKERELTE
jgi:hypothetical protein